MQRRRVLSLLAAAALAGCTAQTGGPPGPTMDEYRPLLRMAVSIGVDRLLTANPQLVPSAQKTLKIVEDTLNRGDFTSVAEVEALLRERIPWQKIDADVRPLIEAVIQAVAEELRVIIQKYQIPDSRTLLLARDVITWAREVAERHLLSTPRVRRVAVLGIVMEETYGASPPVSFVPIKTL